MNIDPVTISSISSRLGNQAISSTEKSSVDFKSIFMDALEEVNVSENKAEDIDEMLAVGDVENLHELRIEAMKADITLNLAVEVRNKIIDAYNEITRLQF